MLARVTAWEGGTAEGIRSASEEMRSNISQGPPPGVKSTGLTMLANPEEGRVVMIGLFANEDDLRESEAALKQMNPPEGLGNRGSIDVYEVGRRRPDVALAMEQLEAFADLAAELADGVASWTQAS